MRLFLTIQYLGTRYSGWQSQTNATSVQQVLEEALEKQFGQPVRTHSAGRTDAGVHAAAMRAHIDVPFPLPARGFIRGTNLLLPHDIRVTAVAEVDDTFHARFDAKGKSYAYRIWNAEMADVFAFETHMHVAQPLDAVRMHEAARLLLGSHDFAIFTVANPEVQSTARTIETIDVVRDGDAVTLAIAADGFLRFMVRRIAGSLIEIGRGKLDPGQLFEEARWTAPAKGLMLMAVRY
jgi:tRNA pseudouridine38-40 synthase